MRLPRWRLPASWGAVVVAACGAYACSDGLTSPDDLERGPNLSLPTAQDLVSAPLPRCGEPSVVRLLSNDGRELGTVTVSNDRDMVSVVYESFGEWEIDATHLSLTGSLEEVPTNPAGLPQIGRFPYISVHEPGRTRVAVSARHHDQGNGAGESVVVAAQAGLVDRNDPTTSDDDELVGTWAEGTLISTRPRGNNGTYFNYEVQACGVTQSVGPEGGTIEISGGPPFVRAQLIIPPGALDQPIEITVDAIPLADVSLPPSGFPQFDDLVAGTSYDFGPDGLEFLVPARIVIGYDESALGGRRESGLTLLRINGGVDQIPGSVVDEDLNQISALVDHFTVYVAAIQDGWSARLEESVGVADEVTITVRSTPRASVEEAVGVIDEVSINVLSTRRPDVAEAVAVADAVSINVVPQPRPSVAEAVAVADQVTVNVLPLIRPGVSESVGVADAVSINVFGSIRPDVSETVGVTEDISITVVPSEGPANFVYVALQGENAVAVIDPNTNTVLTTIAVGTFPYAIAAHPSRPEVYVTNRGDRSVSVIDAQTQSVVATIPNVAGDPIDIAVAGDGSKAYVVDNDSPQLRVIDLTTRTVGTPLQGTTTLARSIVLDFAGTTAYVAGVDSMVVFDLASATADTITGTFDTGDMAVTLDGLDVWISDTTGDEVMVFDRATSAFEATISGLSAPQGVGLDFLTAWVAAGPASIIPVDIPSRTPGTPVALPFEADWIALRLLGANTAYVSEGRGGSRVSVVDLATGTVVATLTVGSSPARIAVTEW